MKVLAVDDDAASLFINQSIVRSLGHDMPGLSGSELCHAVRINDPDLYTYFTVLSSHGSTQDTLNGMGAGADDYLVKPRVVTAAHVVGM